MGTNFFDFKERVTAAKRKPGSGRPPAPVDSLAAGAITVTQLTAQIDRTLRAGFPTPLLVKGEVSNYRPNASSGHVYFTLKDAGACVNCVMWKSDAMQLRFTPSDGMELLARGFVQIYAQQGKYQLYVSSLQPLGQGALELAFQQLRAKLEAEGLFAPECKRPLPRFPARVVLVTGTQTAALADMLKVLRRFPWLRLFVYHVPVQGDGCGQRIAEGLNHVNRNLSAIGGADVIVLARGGGSLEDLWGFNEEAVARAVAASRVPVVTGIGHEVDTSIADLVADYHAHTPTEAAQVVTADWRGARDLLDVTGLRVGRALQSTLQHARQRLTGFERHEVFRRPLYRVNALRQLIDDRERGLGSGMRDQIDGLHRRLEVMRSVLDRNPPSVLLARQRARLSASEQWLSRDTAKRVRHWQLALVRLTSRLGERHPRNEVRLAAQRLDYVTSRLRHGADMIRRRAAERMDALARNLVAVSPEQVLKRGYSMTIRKKDGSLVRAAEQVKAGETIVTRLADGQIESVVGDAMQPGLFE